jgi:hypothetical protein
LPLALVALGVVILLYNFLILSGFNVTALWPLLLVLAGAQILLRGDLLPGGETRPFGVTRGSVESATLEINAGEIDVNASALEREGRLIAGQFAADSRPELQVNENHAHVRMERAATPWLSFNDWDIGMAQDLPWTLYVSTSLGQAQFDLRGLIVQEAVIATGIGDVRVVCPYEAFAPLVLRSEVGNVHVTTPVGTNARVTIEGGRLFRAHVDPNRYQEVEPGVYEAHSPEAGAPLVDVRVSGTFGDAYIG